MLQSVDIADEKTRGKTNAKFWKTNAKFWEPNILQISEKTDKLSFKTILNSQVFKKDKFILLLLQFEYHTMRNPSPFE